MNEFTTLFQQGNAWFFIPSAILLGALHGLEPGHSKTMMAAFIIAIKGTVRQAVMLGLAATFSHTAIVWLIAFGGMYVSQKFTAQAVEPWLQLLSGAIILGTAFWMFWRTWRGERNWLEKMHADDNHTHNEAQQINTNNGEVELSIHEENHVARFRFKQITGHADFAENISAIVDRGNGEQEIYRFTHKNGWAESESEIPEPHGFSVILKLGIAGDIREYQTYFHDHDHDHDHDHQFKGLNKDSKEYQDAHALAHANDIKKRFTSNKVTNWQILLFGLTGGLMPCPAAITILLICIQLKALTLGATLVVCFSIGLALTLVTVGVGAAVGVREAQKRWRGFNLLAQKAPYFSSALIAVVGIYMGIHGYIGLLG
ncbi:nickel/cobalt efflux protein RcnA [Hafnia sp.]|uniref:nickel/cobalt efflux protein RcnA n=1 Tax=Hafnia sp. TaxID=1873498 RepID=UPI002FCB1601